MANKIVKAIIIGAGPAGLSTALRLQQHAGIPCTVYELRDEPTTLGGAIGILPNGMRLLSRLGLHDDLVARGSSQSQLTIRSLQGNILSTGDLVGPARKQTGFGYLRIKRTDLQDVMLTAVDKAGISVHYGKRLTSINDGEDGVSVTFSDGAVDTASVLFACDGIHSGVRQLHVDPTQRPEYTGISTLTSLLPASILAEDQAAAIKGMNPTFTTKGSFMAMKATASDDEIYWGFSKEVSIPTSGDTKDGWEVHRKEQVDTLKNHVLGLVKGVSGQWSNTIRTLVENTSIIKCYPVYKLPLGGKWYRGRCLLLGDAAHAMAPHAGQGVSMALEDAFLIAKILKNGDQNDTPASMFETFEKIRRPRVDKISKQALENGKMRRDSSAWGLKVKEFTIMGYLWLSWSLGLQKWGAANANMIYDVEEEKV